MSTRRLHLKLFLPRCNYRLVKILIFIKIPRVFSSDLKIYPNSQACFLGRARPREFVRNRMRERRVWPFEASMFVIHSVFVSSLLQTGGGRSKRARSVCPKSIPTRHDESAGFLMHISLAGAAICVRNENRD